MNDYEALLHQAKRLEALQEIRNLMGRYSYLHSAFRNKEYAELWAKRDDDRLVMPFGRLGSSQTLLCGSSRRPQQSGRS